MKIDINKIWSLKALSPAMVALLLTMSSGTAIAQSSDGGNSDLDSLLGSAPAPAAAAPKAAPATTKPTPSPEQLQSRPVAPVPSAGVKSTDQQAPAKTGAAAVRVKKTANSDRAVPNRLVEEIIVTATKRKENIQDVPIAVSAFSGEKLDALGIKTANDLPQITPGLTITGLAGFSLLFLRGVGTDAFLPAADPAVPIYLDGIALLNGQGVTNTLGRVQRVEVLKGPQGTLFGRNSIGGAVSITTPDPGPEFGGDAQVEMGNYGTFNEIFFLNLPIVDGLAATISGYSQRHNPYTVNTAAANFDSYSRGARVKLRWQATDNLSFHVGALVGEESDSGSLLTENIRPAPIVGGLGLIVPADPKADRSVSENTSGGETLNNYIIDGGADWNLPWIELKALGSTQRLNVGFVQTDFDGSIMPLVSFESSNEFANQRTGELQILSNDGTPFNQYFSFIAGAYYLQGDGGFPTVQLQVAQGSGLLAAVPGGAGFAGSLNNLLAGVNLPPIVGLTGPVTLNSGGVLASRSLSGYFQGTVHLQNFFDLSRPVNVILGARLDEETRGLEDNRLGVVNPLNNNNQEITLLRFHVPAVKALQVPLKVELQWFPIDNIQLYGSFSRGFTAPTYNTVDFFSAPDALQPAKVDSYELGAKTRLLDETLTLNVAAFYIQEHNQLASFVSLDSGGIVRFDNVPASRIFGAEFDATWQFLPELDPGLVFIGSASYLNSKYTNYQDGRGFDVATGLSFGVGAFLPARDFTGNRIVRTPRYSFDVGLNQSIPLGDAGRLEIAADTYYNDGFYFLPQNDPVYSVSAYELVNARISYFYKPWGIEVTAFGKNLTQENYINADFATDFGNQISLNPPRTYGLRFKYTF